ncbi:MAG: RluA family pseudouridine synthase [Myxococcaceae bacterium]|nr:RluA family pseudouridine synthase [Myxococcaceae bacterium]
MLEFRITEDHAGVRLDKFLKKKLDRVPVSHLFKMIRVKKVRVNGKRAQPDQDLLLGDVITIRGDEKQLLTPAPKSAEASGPLVTEADLEQLKVLYEDEWLLVMDKPSGMAVHTGSGITGGTVVDVVRAYLGNKAVRNDFAASPAHRLDRETSGVIVVAKRRPAMVHFTDVFTHSKARKRYLALVKGTLAKPKGLIDLPLSEHQQTAKSKAERGVNMQPARTRYTLLSQGDDCALVSCTIETGRTHQIRRHMAAIGHPVLGDKKYGDFPFNREAKNRWGLKRLFLHAEAIDFPHPEDGRRVAVEANLPRELAEVLNAVGLTLGR